MAILNDKLEALKSFIIETEDLIDDEEIEELENETVATAYNREDKTFEVIGLSYMVLTDREADKLAKKRIKDGLYLFDIDFILEHTSFYSNYNTEVYKAFRDKFKKLLNDFGEDTNPIIAAFIDNFDEFVVDAIDTYGREHFIAWYDDMEYEEGDFFIYRID